jgi:hypothetical protein
MIEPLTRRPISSTISARPEIPSHRLAECMRLDCGAAGSRREASSQHKGETVRGVSMLLFVGDAGFLALQCGAKKLWTKL